MATDLTGDAHRHDVNPSRIAKRSLADDAADQLRRLILLGSLPPGGAVRERELAERLGISRTPIREAVRMLEVEGLICYSPTRRPFVANPTFEDIDKAMLVLAALECLAGEQACIHARDSELHQVGALNDRMLELSGAGEALEFFEADMAFHRAIVKAAHNEVLEDANRSVNARLWRARFISSRRMTARHRTLAQHQEIYECLVSRDPRATAHAVRNHLESAVNNIRASLRDVQERRSDAVEHA